MFNKFYKNDYKFRKDLKDFANKNWFGKILKPLFKGPYDFINRYLPYPRDFLLKKIPKNGVCCEIGAYEGVFSERIEKICKPQKLYLIDPWTGLKDRTEEKYDQKHQDRRYNIVMDKFRNEISDGKVVIIRQTSDQAASKFKDEFFDFVYIDGDHSYQQVKKDLNNYYPKVKRGGFLGGDDYPIESVKLAVEEFAKGKSIVPQLKNQQFIFRKTDYIDSKL
ncbi:MAG: class I SAM-dependent methyltransferase [Patescibacteria group bacterium]